MKEVCQFTGPQNKNGHAPRYAIFVTKNGAFEIFEWKRNKKNPSKSRWKFYAHTGKLQYTVEMMLSLTAGDTFAEDAQKMINAWDTAVKKLMEAIEENK